MLSLDPGSSYELTGTVGKGTGDLVFTLNASTFGSSIPGESLQLDHSLVVNPDGTFTIYLGPTDPGDAMNYLDTTDMTTLIMRDKMANLALGPSQLHVECIADCVETGGMGGTGLSTDNIQMLLQAMADYTEMFNKFNIEKEAEPAGITLPANTMSPFSNSDVEGGFPGQFLSMGHFKIEPDQALIIKVPQVDAGYQSIQLNNAFGATLPGTLAQTTLNNSQTFHGSDGYTYYVVSATNPGVANWLDNGDVSEGSMIARYQNLPDGGTSPDGMGVTTEVVPLSEVRDYLPDDFPTVSAEQFAAIMNERVLSLDYALDVTRGDNWVVQQVIQHDLESAMGSDNYEAVFGVQPFTPMWLRLTPALSPDWLSVAKGMFTDPTAGFTAIQENMSLAINDIVLPMKLAAALLYTEAVETGQTVQTALADGDFMQALTAVFTAGQQFGSILSDALFDPNISITAGILNARDDLATSIMAATGGFPTELGPVATWQWEHMDELVQMSPATMLQDLFSLLN